MNKDLILEIYKRPQTVFTLKEFSLIFPKISYKNLKARISYFVKVGKLKRLRQGVYAKENFEILEAVNKIYTPSYISLETVLQKEGVVFQEYKTVFAVSYLTRRIRVNGREIFYRKIKDTILLNNAGVKKTKGCFMATCERAFLDAVFLYKDYHFDNLEPIDWGKVKDLIKIYSNKSLNKRVKDYYDQRNI